MRRMKIALALVLLAGIVLGVFVWTLPADVAYRYGASKLGPVALSGLRGTLWHGHADGVSVFGRDIGELDWHAHKLPALTGKLVADLRIKGADVDVAGLMARGSDRIAVRDLRFSLPASLLAPALGIADLNLLGRITGTVTEATLQNAALRDVVGNAHWSEAGVSGAADARFSDILADFASQADGSVVGSVRDDGKGDLEVDGRFSARIGAFDAQARLSARNGNTEVAEALRHIGEQQADGSSLLLLQNHVLGSF